MAIRTITVPVKDLEAAKGLYSLLLGVEPYVDQPYYAGFRPENGPEVGLDPHGDVAAGPVVHWHTGDLDATLAALIAAGATEERSPHEIGDGARLATVRDIDGHLIGLFEGPPL
ncbi:VOC family protein [Actinoplanes xinjiangensis]|jgi:predicted enzyme related to lactoylglutathione lyase|uniref:Putative enzyme related to lactoylglutathione lyase n=1 Tax=Actinoplanes xinjiangensis TaxID=512350 RepID=A0A316FNL4_9ACTN|nr:VOC family protein [Actinoplanes xinjiangensis]PWK49795.1 putative enzyme related to lactoylglutathione lyase [Actinoplanes xinjiangensis]GIF37801.1 glyoxalase [Actinoplanes xinjiangensis]